MIESRRDYLGFPEFADINELNEFVERAFTSALYLSLHFDGIKSIDADHVASHIGKALGISLILQQLPRILTERGQLLLPRSIQLAVRSNCHPTFVCGV